MYFNRMYVGKSTVNLPNTLENIFSNFKKQRYSSIPEIENLNGYHLYVSGMKREMIGTDVIDNKGIARYLYAMNISAINPSETIVYGDLTKKVNEREHTVSKDENGKELDDNQVGPLSDTQIVIDPSRRFIGSVRGLGRLNSYFIQKFLQNLFKTSAMRFDVVPNRKSIEDVKKLNTTQKLSFRVASPDNFQSFADENDAEMNDVKFAQSFKANEYTIILDSSNFPKRKLVKKVKYLLNSSETKSLKVEGINDGQEEQLDLFKNKLIYDGEVIYRKDITARDYMDFLIYGYKTIFDSYIHDVFVADQEIEVQSDAKGKTEKK